MDYGLEQIRKDLSVFCYHMVKKFAAQLYVYYVSDSIFVSIARNSVQNLAYSGKYKNEFSSQFSLV